MRILSIDIDYIIEDFDNEKLDNELRPWFDRTRDAWQYWWMVLQKGEQFSQKYNKGNFEFIERVFINALRGKPRVIFGTDHDDIFHHIGDATELEIVNIDAHHDLVQDHDKFHEGSWGWYLWPRVRNWTWVKNKAPDGGGSKLTKDPVDPKLTIIKKHQWEEEATTDFGDFQPDFIYVCLSVDYLDPKFWWAYGKLRQHYRKHLSEHLPPAKPLYRSWDKEMQDEETKN